jgi:hypothetical protein
LPEQAEATSIAIQEELAVAREALCAAGEVEGQHPSLEMGAMEPQEEQATECLLLLDPMVQEVVVAQEKPRQALMVPMVPLGWLLFHMLPRKRKTKNETLSICGRAYRKPL